MKKKILLAGTTLAIASISFFVWHGKISQAQTSENKAELYLSDGYREQAVVTLTSEQEPAVYIRSYNISGQIKISLYEASMGDLLFYMVHDQQNEQKNPSVDVSKLKYLTTIYQEVQKNEESDRVLLPLDHSGIWVVRMESEDEQRDSFIIRSRIGAVTKNTENNKLLVWSQDLASGKTIRSGNIEVYNLKDKIKKIQETSIGENGLAEVDLKDEADIITVRTENSQAIIPINIKRYSGFNLEGRSWKYFVLTDRPIYRPGDNMSFSGIYREDDDGRYSLPQGKVKASIYRNWVSSENLVMEKEFPASDWGSASGEFKFPEGMKTGDYILKVESTANKNSGTAFYGGDWENGIVNFKVEYYQKPEYDLSIEMPKKYLIAGDKATLKLKGNYFFGQPLQGKQIQYKIYLDDYYDYYYYGERESDEDPIVGGYWNYGDEYSSGSVTLSEKGEAEVLLDANLPDDEKNSQVMIIEAEFQDESGVPIIAQKNILVRRAEFDIRSFRQQYSYLLNENAKFNFELKSFTGASVKNIKLKADIERNYWVREEKEGRSYWNYRHEKDDLGSKSFSTDGDGLGGFDLKMEKPGSYKIKVSGTDQRGNALTKEFNFWVPEDNGFYYDFSDREDSGITVKVDKEKYNPRDKVLATISSVASDRDVLMTVERARVNRYQIVSLNGTSANAEIPLQDSDMPNMFVSVSSFSPVGYMGNEQEISVSAENKKMKVNIISDKEKYGPGDQVEIKVKTSDQNGNPVSAEMTVFLVDKAVFELSDSNTGDIYTTFWKERYNQTQESNSLEKIIYSSAEMGGCFSGDTLITMASGENKAISEIKEGDFVLAQDSKERNEVREGKVLSVHKTKAPGNLIINGQLKITPNHKLLVNDEWITARNIRPGDELLNGNNEKVSVFSIEWQAGELDVYNLEVEKYHTFFAENIWVHNEKGGGEDRSIFNDTAYWNPSVKTGEDGEATISFRLPDNLTTWAIAAVGATRDTMVGQSKKDILATKDLFIRPILPNVFRISDELKISALVHNYTSQEKNLKIKLEFANGEVAEPEKNIKLSSENFQQIVWNVKPKIKSENAKISFIVNSLDGRLADSVTEEIPVREIGYWETQAFVGSGDVSFPIKFNADSDISISKVNLSMGASLFGQMPSAFRYLIDYPYGCIEQTTSRFVPVVIAKRNPEIFSTLIEGKPLDDMINVGSGRLIKLQAEDGGWPWFNGKSKPYVTAYVVEYLDEARLAGIEVDETMMSRAEEYLLQKKNDKNISLDDKVSTIYALSILGNSNGKEEIIDFENLSPDLLAYAIMANQKNGFKESAKKGLDILISKKIDEGNTAYWNEGRKDYFGSEEASTALAIRAILATGGDRDLAMKGARYLAGNKKQEYWANTFGTAQVMRAITELSRAQNESSTGYYFEVFLDGTGISSGTMSKFTDMKDIEIPSNKIKAQGSEIKIIKNGEGQMYSDLMIKEFRKSADQPKESNELAIKRSYYTSRKDGESLVPGDIIGVEITLSGTRSSEDDYMVIEDSLPSGLVPVNTRLNNEKSHEKQKVNMNIYNDIDYRLDGVNMYQDYSYGRKGTYKYLARVVSDGIYKIPPASVSLMYNPEINARTKIENFEDLLKYNVPLSAFSGTTYKSLAPNKQVAEGFFKKSPVAIAFMVVIVLTIFAIGGILVLRWLEFRGYSIWKK